MKILGKTPITVMLKSNLTPALRTRNSNTKYKPAVRIVPQPTQLRFFYFSLETSRASCSLVLSR
jgi:hypothetical protein